YQAVTSIRNRDITLKWYDKIDSRPTLSQPSLFPFELAVWMFERISKFTFEVDVLFFDDRE
ncbi:hypothetical protein, partial [Haloferula sp. A504]|uniref:hypothetical protein n=1 Tax=Haloferula sp. A504 TaxID=3373601 RepID=UPI0031C218FE|nr:hypothetical protein [Verrucomicrobiaceae bacterium E54]